jgi:hypothetical protein
MSGVKHLSRRPYLVLALVGMVVFGSLLTAEFTWWDDGTTIHHNPRLNPPSWDTLVYYWTHAEYAIFIPLTYTVWAGLSFLARTPTNDWGIGLNPFWFHLANGLFHWVSAGIVYRILYRILGCSRASLLGGLAFLVHPIQVESVAWISGLKDVLSGCCVLGAVYWFIRFRETGVEVSDISDPKRASFVRWGISGFLLLLALLSKPSAMTTPALIFLIDTMLLKTPWKRSVRDQVPFLILVIPFMVIARMVQPASSIESPWWARPLIALDSIVFYWGKILFPYPLVLDYGRTPSYLIQTGQLYWTWMFVIPMGLILIYLWKKQAYLPVCGALLSVVAPIHTLGWVRFEFQSVSTVADHYLYVGMLGVGMIVARIASQSQTTRWGMVGLVAIWSIVSMVQCRVWKDHETLMRHTFEHTPFGKVGASNLASWAIANRDLGMAKKYSDIALKNWPDEPIVLVNAAWIALFERQDEQARNLLLRNVQVHERHYGKGDPRVAEAWIRAAEAYLATNRLTEAEEALHHARKLNPDRPDLVKLFIRLQNAQKTDSIPPPD